MLEELLGEEIVDETDDAVDMREVAMEQRGRRFGEAVDGEVTTDAGDEESGA